jgi:hypothetical protein
MATEESEPLEKYRQLWAYMWPLGLLVLSGFGVAFLRRINRSIVAATQQHLVELLANRRFFPIDHPDLVEIRGRTPEEREFVERTGGWQRWFIRRNIITHLELLYFQNKYKAIDKAFFHSQCSHIRPWFQQPDGGFPLPPCCPSTGTCGRVARWQSEGAARTPCWA